ncbi:MAG TPA: flagellar hook-associated protein FlgL [Polyangiaceae bacterium]
MRITDGMKYGSVLRNLTSLGARHAKASQQALTGNRIGAPSDDPSGAAELLRVHSSLSRAQAQRDAIKNARGDVELAEGVLSEVNTLFQRAHEIAMQGSNGNLSADNRAALATEVGDLKRHLVSLANTKGSRGFLFGGSQTDVAPFDANGTFSGNDLEHSIQLGNGSPTRVSVSGASAFTSAGGRDIFADLDALQAGLAADDGSAVSATLGSIETSRQQVIREQTQAGLTINRLDTSDASLDQLELSLSKREQAVGAADPFEAYARMSSLAQALERAVTVSRQILDLGADQRF